jgi:hypothetical protein
MRVLVGLTALLSFGGCSVLFDGSDLVGSADGSAGGDDLAGIGGGGSGGGGGGGGGGGNSDMGQRACTTLSQPPTLKPKRVTVGGNAPFQLGAADVDGDGHIDIVTANQESKDVSVMLGDGAGGFTLAGGKTFASGCPTNTVPYWMALGDFDGNRRPDLAITCFDYTSSTANGLVVILNTSTAPGSVTFAAPKSIDPKNVEQDYLEVATGDFNGDHRDDLAISHYGLNSKPGALVVLTSVGDGSFNHDPVHQRFAMPSGAADIGVGDLNADGLADIVVGSGDYWIEELISVAAAPGTFNRGRIGFDTAKMMGTIAYPRLPVIADLDGDHKNDLEFAEGYSGPSGYAALFLQDTNNAFAPDPKEYPTVTCPSLNAVADFNCDGKPDIVVGSLGCSAGDPRTIEVLLQGVNTTFPTRAPTLTLTSGPYGMAVADFNEDGLPDIVVGSGSGEFDVNVLITTPQ